jgi:hypothetical protein
LPIDQKEAIEEEADKLDAGVQTTVEAIMRLDHIEREEAEEKAKEIDGERKVPIPFGAPSTTEPPQDDTDEEQTNEDE